MTDHATFLRAQATLAEKDGATITGMQFDAAAGEIDRLRAVVDAAKPFALTPGDCYPDHQPLSQCTHNPGEPTAGDCRKLSAAYRDAAKEPVDA